MSAGTLLFMQTLADQSWGKKESSTQFNGPNVYKYIQYFRRIDLFKLGFSKRHHCLEISKHFKRISDFFENMYFL